MSPQAVSADTIQNSAVGIFSPKTGGTKTKADKKVTTQFKSLYFAHLEALKSNNIVKLITFLKTPQRLNPK
jgi:hypothetical protein